MKRSIHIVYPVAVLSLLILRSWAGEVLLKENQVIKFDKEVWIKVSPPCTLGTSGSKLTVYPQSVKFADFVKLVNWKHGMPAYLRGTDPASTTFDFDLTDLTTFKGEMILKIVRTTRNFTSDGVVVIYKNSNLPVVIGPPKK